MVRILRQNYLSYSYEIIRDSYVLFIVVCCKNIIECNYVIDDIYQRGFFVMFYLVTLKHPNSDKCTIITAIKDTYL